ncbi:MAG: hypothetical protein CSA34_03275 [Desulfobulbus propionicus]|nr:MAG: hypothetical protein CSA34_03275 [Desulfobulbus propionicus]
MIARIRRNVLAVLPVFFLLSCSGAGSRDLLPADPQLSLSCIGVLPVARTVDYDGNLTSGNAENLKNGRQIMDQLYEQYFRANAHIRFVSDAQVEGLDVALAGNALEQFRAIADRLSCNAVLETTLLAYKDRAGGEYSVKDPARVGFTYRLVETRGGRTLCSATFEETQQSLMENLFTLGKATSRGFRWVTAEELLREGIQQKLGECPYLQRPQT